MSICECNTVCSRCGLAKPATATSKAADGLILALERALVSPAELDSNLESCNIVDGLCRLARAITKLADAVKSR
jgi:hypothetical protein